MVAFTNASLMAGATPFSHRKPGLAAAQRRSGLSSSIVSSSHFLVIATETVYLNLFVAGESLASTVTLLRMSMRTGYTIKRNRICSALN